MALSFIFSGRVSAANLFISPVSGEYEAGGRFSVSLKVNTENAAINAVDGTLDFRKDLLEVVSVSKKDSIITLWIQEPVFSNKNGTITFGGLVLNPGYQGISGTILTIEFKVRKEGSGGINFSSGSVLANDGYGTNVLKSLSGASFVFTQKEVLGSQPIPAKSSSLLPQIFSPTHPEPTKWYSNNAPIFQWPVPAGVKAVKLVFARNPESPPLVLYQPPISQKELLDINDGIWYFKAQFIKDDGEAPIAKFRFNIDTVRPDDFEIVRIDESDLTDPRPELIFESNDELSGIDRYEMKIGGGDWFRIEPDLAGKPYRLPIQLPGERKVLTRAYDQAGNFSEAQFDLTVKSIKPPIVFEIAEPAPRGEPVTILGQAEPLRKVKVFIVYNPVVELNTLAGINANWSAVYDKGSLKRGKYEVRAYAINDQEAVSNISNTVSVQIKANLILGISDLLRRGLDNLVNFIVNNWFLEMGIIFLAGLIYWTRASVIPNLIKEAKRFIHIAGKYKFGSKAKKKNIKKQSETKELRDDFKKELTLLEKIKKRRTLDPDEEYLKEKLKKYLNFLKSSK